MSRPVIICIGTPRVTGDSVAPLLGEKLIKADFPCYVYGTVSRPVTRKNIDKYLEHINKYHHTDPIIAVDVALGDKEKIGSIVLSDKGVSPAGALDGKKYYVGDLGLLAVVGDKNNSVTSELISVKAGAAERLACKLFNLLVKALQMKESKIS